MAAGARHVPEIQSGEEKWTAHQQKQEHYSSERKQIGLWLNDIEKEYKKGVDEAEKLWEGTIGCLCWSGGCKWDGHWYRAGQQSNSGSNRSKCNKNVLEFELGFKVEFVSDKFEQFATQICQWYQKKVSCNPSFYWQSWKGIWKLELKWVCEVSRHPET